MLKTLLINSYQKKRNFWHFISL